MPTPFMHLSATHRLLQDESVPLNLRMHLKYPEHLGAYLLGNVAPDARVSGGLERANTHFFDYAETITPHAVDTMLTTHPQLRTAQGAQQAFVCGYIGHLAMDVVWAEAMLYPYFYMQKDWADTNTRYLMLHVLLCHMDERDYQQWDAGYNALLAAATPQKWLPFLGDQDLIAWRDIIARQIVSENASETLAVLGKRVPVGEAGLAAYLKDEAKLNTDLFAYVPLAAIAKVEEIMYHAMIKYVIEYLSGTQES